MKVKKEPWIIVTEESGEAFKFSGDTARSRIFF